MTSAPLDLTDPAVVADPYPSFARARAQAPVQWHEEMGLWLAFTHAESNAVLRDRRLGRIWRDKAPAERFESFNLIHSNAILEMEPPEHTRLRRLISSAFARTRAGAPPGRMLASVTSRPSVVLSAAVAAGTSSRSATQSASPGSPSNERITAGA